MIRYQGVRFQDGSVALRRLDSDPCERHTLTFDSWVECKDELGETDTISWIADARGRALTVVAPGRGVEVLFGDPPGRVPIVGSDGRVIGHTIPLDISKYVAGAPAESEEV